MLGSIESRLPQRSVVAIDLLVVLWTVSWLVLGIAVGTFVDRLGGIGESLEGTGQAIHRAGDAVDGLSDVPLVGEGFGSLAQRDPHDRNRDGAARRSPSSRTSIGSRC